ncbi:MAG: hypothetical protein ACRDSJ_09220 [Rubrobacteraceae bacterium]
MLSRFFDERHSFCWVGGSSGLSGFAKVESGDKLWCLRRWPDGFSEERPRFIHRAMSRSRENGFTGVPELAKTNAGDTVVNRDGVLFEAQAWLAEEPLSGRSFQNEPLPNVVSPPPTEVLFSRRRGGAFPSHTESALSLPERSLSLPEEWRSSEMEESYCLSRLLDSSIPPSQTRPPDSRWFPGFRMTHAI